MPNGEKGPVILLLTLFQDLPRFSTFSSSLFPLSSSSFLINQSILQRDEGKIEKNNHALNPSSNPNHVPLQRQRHQRRRRKLPAGPATELDLAASHKSSRHTCICAYACTCACTCACTVVLARDGRSRSPALLFSAFVSAARERWLRGFSGRVLSRYADCASVRRIGAARVEGWFGWVRSSYTAIVCDARGP